MSLPNSQTKQPEPRARRFTPARLAETVIETGRDGIAGGYVSLVRGAGRLARVTGGLDALDRRRDRRGALYLRSLFAVHDLEELDRLDVPWWTFGAIARVDAFLAARRGQARAFEWGAGASTLWLSRRCSRVVSVEHDARWWPPLAELLRPVENVEAELVPPTPSSAPICPSSRAGWTGLDFAAYVRAIRGAGGPFDLIVIDGRARPSCLGEAVRHLAPGGLVVLDNAGRRRYAGAIAASSLGIDRCVGLAPAMPWPSQTALMAERPATLQEAA